ncbi:MAG: hypothetical protein PHX62_00645 [Bacilli bacterium]|nr:hypothetical protein [Bacilli bacterium]
MKYKNLKKTSLFVITITIVVALYLINYKPITAVSSYEDLFINSKDMDIAFNQEAPSQFLNHEGVLVDRDFDLGMKGTLLSSNKNGSSVELSQTFYGSFETSFRAYSATNYHDVSGTDWNSSTIAIPETTDLKEVAFTFTAKNKESFTVYITAGEKWNTVTPAARVEFSDVQIGYHYTNDSKLPNDTGLKNSGGYYTRIGGTTFANIARTGGKLSGSNSKPLRFGFNMETMEIYVIHYGTLNTTEGTYRVVVDLDSEESGARRMEAFNEYTVSIKMTSIASNRTANMIIYDINGQSLNQETLTNNAGPKLYVDEQITGIVNEKFYLNKPTSFDLIDGLIAFNGSIKVFDANNNQIPIRQANGENLVDDSFIEGCYFVPDNAGKYEIVYIGKDLSEFAGEEYRIFVNVVPQFIESVYMVSGSYRGLQTDGKIAKNSEIDIYSADVFSAMHNNKLLKAEVTVLKDGEVYKDISNLKAEEDFKLKLEAVGQYSIVYKTPDYENSNLFRVDFQVVDNYPLFSGSSLEKIYDFQSIISIPNVTATLNGQTKTTTITLYDPDGTRISNTDNVRLEKPGEYKVAYLVRFESDYTYTKYFTVCYSNSNLFSTEDIGVNIDADSDSGSLYPSKIPGIVINSEMTNGSVTYNRIIDLSMSTKYDSLIELSVLPSKIGMLDFCQFTIRLTDAHNPKNYLDITTYKGNWGNEWSYVKAGASGQVKSGWENGKILNAYNTGTPIGFSFTGESLLGNEIFQLYYDNQERAVYVDNIKRPGYSYGNQVIDLDSVDCFSETPLWNGFTTGEVILSLHFEFVETTDSKILIKSIAGVDFGGKYSSDNVGPSINVDFEEYDSATLPKGLVNIKYPIFNAKAFDKINGFVDYQVKVYKDYQTANQTEVAVSEDYFLPTTSGSYSIVYLARDLMANTGERVVKIDVVDSLPDLDYHFEKEISSSAKVGEIFTLPSGAASGGSGNKTVEIVVKDPNGNVINLENMKFKFLIEGNYTITVSIRDFLKQDEELIKQIEVSLSEFPIIYDFNIPPYFVNGDEYILPDFEALDYTSAGIVKDVNKSIQVTYNGKTITLNSDRKFRPDVLNDGDEITITYLAKTVSTNKVTKKTFNPRVVIVSDDGVNLNLSRYFYKENIKTINLTDNYIEFLTDVNNSRLSLVNPIISSAISFEVVIPKDYNNMDSFTVTLVDSLDPSIAVDLTIYKNLTDSSTTTTISINGGPKQSITGSFYERTSYGFALTFNKASNYIIDSNNLSLIEKIRYTKYGAEFVGFTSDKAYISFAFDNVAADAGLRIKTIANQPFSNITEDRIRPLISISENIKLVGEINEEFSVPYAYASDVLSNNVNLSAVIRQGNKVIYEGKIDENYIFTPTSYGIYRIIYTAIDGAGRKQDNTYIITIKDRIPPVITINGSIKSEVKAGDTVKLPEATVEDNHDLELRLYIFIIAPDGELFTLEAENYEFIPNLIGDYSVFYYAQDSYNSYSYSEYLIKVK